MGLAFCPGEDVADEGFDAIFMRCIDFIGGNVKSNLRSASFNGRDSEPTILKTFASGKFVVERSRSFRKEDSDPFQLEAKISIQSPTSEKEIPFRQSFQASRFSPSRKRALESPVAEADPVDSPEHQAAVKLQKVYKSFRTRRQLADCAVLVEQQAAVKLQKVYKSFRTRRQLADCAVLVEQRWWKLLDFALLKRNSVSFFDIDEPESAVSRWLRARRRAALVGKGLAKDKKARKLALQHWLEAIDPRHRYGHNLHFYYDCWLRCESKEPFFYWLDVGEGKEVNLEDQCPRSKLQQQCIKYLGPKEREAYEVVVEDGKFLYRQSRELIDTSEGPKDSKSIFVLSTLKTLYVGQKKKGTFQHSSFLAGGATSAAGRLVVENGILKAVWPHSGHYRPTEENFQEFMNFLKENNVDLTDVQLSPAEDDAETSGLKSFRSEVNLIQGSIDDVPQSEVETSCASVGTRSTAMPKIRSSFEASEGVNCSSLSTELELKTGITEKCKKLNKLVLKDPEESDNEADEKVYCPSETKRFCSSEKADEPDFSNPADSSEVHKLVEEPSTAEDDYMFCKKNLFMEEKGVDEETSVPKELILRRINSKKGMKSYQLGRQLSCKWTTGAGPRIGCVRDYPSELQFLALEQVHLSPRNDRQCSSPRPFSSSLNPSMETTGIPDVPLL